MATTAPRHALLTSPFIPAPLYRKWPRQRALLRAARHAGADPDRQQVAAAPHRPAHRWHGRHSPLQRASQAGRRVEEVGRAGGQGKRIGRRKRRVDVEEARRLVSEGESVRGAARATRCPAGHVATSASGWIARHLPRSSSTNAPRADSGDPSRTARVEPHERHARIGPRAGGRLRLLGSGHPRRAPILGQPPVALDAEGAS